MIKTGIFTSDEEFCGLDMGKIRKAQLTPSGPRIQLPGYDTFFMIEFIFSLIQVNDQNPTGEPEQDYSFVGMAHIFDQHVDSGKI